MRDSVQRWRTEKEATTMTLDHFEGVTEVFEEEDAHVELKATGGVSDDEGSAEPIDAIVNEGEVIGEELPSLLMGEDTGLPSMRDYCDCILHVEYYVIFIEIYWSIHDGYMYWRSVFFMHGILTEWMVTFERYTLGVPHI